MEKIIHLIGDDHLRLAGFLLALGGVGGGDLVEIVDIIQKCVVNIVDPGIDITGHGDIDKEDRPVMPPANGPLHLALAQYVMGRAGGADDDIRHGQIIVEFLEGDGAAVKLFRHLLGARQSAVGDDKAGDAMRSEMRGGELTHLAGADQQRRPAFQLLEDLASHINGHRRDRHRVLADAGLGTHPLAHLQGVAEEPVQQDTGALALMGGVIGFLDLAHDLGLTHHQRIEATRYPVEMADSSFSLVIVGAVFQFAQLDGGHLRQCRHDFAAAHLRT